MKHRFDIAIGTPKSKPLERYVFDSFAGPLLERVEPLEESALEQAVGWSKDYLPSGVVLDAVAGWALDEPEFGASRSLMLATWALSSADHPPDGLDPLLAEADLPSSADQIVSVGSWIGDFATLAVVLPIAAQIVSAHPTAVGWMGHPDTSVFASTRWLPLGPDRGPFGPESRDSGSI